MIKTEKLHCTGDSQCPNGDVCVNGNCVPDIGSQTVSVPEVKENEADS